MRRFLSLLLVVLLLFSLLAIPASAMSAGAVVASYHIFMVIFLRALALAPLNLYQVIRLCFQ